MLKNVNILQHHIVCQMLLTLLPVEYRGNIFSWIDGDT